MDKMIAMLEPRAAQVVRGIGIDGESIAEIGKRLDMTEGAVRVMLHRSLHKLADLRKRFVEI
jgi:RNA polymerase sigma-70 factor (ECF subfamily)